MIERIGLKVIITIVLGLALVVLLAVKGCSSNREEAEQARQDSRDATALADTAKEAAETVIENAEENASIDELVEAAKKEIDNAPNDEAAGDAARAAICGILPDDCGNPAE